MYSSWKTEWTKCTKVDGMSVLPDHPLFYASHKVTVAAKKRPSWYYIKRIMM